MRRAVLRTLPPLLAAALAACDVTLPWTGDEPTHAPPGSGNNTGSGSFSAGPARLLFAAQPAGARPPAQRVLAFFGPAADVRVTSTGAVSSAALLSRQTTYVPVDVSVAAPIGAGTTYGTVTVTGCADTACTAQVAGSPVVIQVTYAVVATPTSGFAVTPTSLTFNGQSGGTTPASQRIDLTITSAVASLRAVGVGAAAGAIVTRDSTTTAHVDVSVRAPMGSGTVTGSVAITGCSDAGCTGDVAGSPVVVPVTYAVTPSTSSTALRATVSSLSFQMTAGLSNPAAATFTLSNAGNGSGPWYSCISTWWAPIGGWIGWTPYQGTTLPATITVTADGTGIAAGSSRNGSLIFQTVPCSQSDVDGLRIPVVFDVN